MLKYVTKLPRHSKKGLRRFTRNFSHHVIPYFCGLLFPRTPLLEPAKDAGLSFADELDAGMGHDNEFNEAFSDVFGSSPAFSVSQESSEPPTSPDRWSMGFDFEDGELRRS